MKRKKNLTSEQENIFFNEATEPPGSSELNNEKREGTYNCANCDTILFESDTKFESKLKETVQLLIAMRNEARENKDFKLSDKIRDHLLNIGIQLNDGKEGTTFTIENK